MCGKRVGATIALGALAVVCFSHVSWAEDCITELGVPGGPGGALLGNTRPSSFMSAIPGSTFVVSVSHIVPSPEDAMENGRPARCDAVRFRIDMLKVNAQDGSVEVELGQPQELAPGESFRNVYTVNRDDGNNPLPTYELDQMGFRFRSEPASARCSIVSNALFFADPSTKAPIPLALVPSAGPGCNNAGTPGGR